MAIRVERRTLVTALSDNPVLYYMALPKRLRHRPAATLILFFGGLAIAGMLGGWALVRAYPGVGAVVGFVVGLVWALLTVLVPVAQLAGDILGERQKRTWEMLVMTPLGPAGIILGKVLGTLLPLWTLGAMLLPFVFVLTYPATRGAPWREVWFLPLLLAIYVGTVLTSASFGLLALYCSMRCTSTISAQLLAFGVVFGLQFCSSICTMPLALALLLIPFAIPVVQYVLLLAPGAIAGWHMIARFEQLDKRSRG